MRRSLALIIAAGLALGSPLGLASGAFAQKIDKNGRCHDAAGRFAKMEVCRGLSAPVTSAKPTSPSTSVGPASAGPATALRCRDKTTKRFAKCGAANSEPVPAGK